MKSPVVGITGSRGRLGTYFIKQMSKAGRQVVAYSRKPDREHVDLSLLFRHCRENKMDFIYHFGWSVVPAEAESNPRKQWKEDLPFLEKMLTTLMKMGRGSPRLIFLSSCAVYGEGPTAEGGFDEADPPSPRGFYGRAKAEAELMILSKMKAGLPATILRVTNIYGTSQAQPRPQGVISALFRAATTGEPFLLWGNGAATKDYLFVDDFYRLMEFMTVSGRDGIYNVGSGESVSVRKLIEIVQDLTKSSICIQEVPTAPWDVQHGKFSFDRIRQATGWAPSFSLEKGLSRIWQGLEATPQKVD